MQTTITVDDDVLEAARAVAEERGISLGAAVSHLVRLGLERRIREPAPGRFPVFSAPANGRPLTNDLVREALEDDG